MHYSKGAVTLLSTVFTFQVKTVVVADIVDSSNEVLLGTDTAVNGLTSTPTSSPTSAKIKLKRKRNHSNAVDVDTGILNSDETAASVVMDASSVSMAIAATAMCLDCDNGFVRGEDATTVSYTHLTLPTIYSV